MRARTVLVSGGTGIVGRFIAERFLASGLDVRVAGRNEPAPDAFLTPVGFLPQVLGKPPAAGLFDGVDWFVHAAFDHEPGKYRGGEGADPDGFRRRNLDGTVMLFQAAKAAGVGKAVFLSSRAVYGKQPPEMRLDEETEPHPDTLYGEIKLAAERQVLGMADDTFSPNALRVTGVYGHGQGNKWAGLLEDYLAGKTIAPRVATEVHGEDIAVAVHLVLSSDARREIFNVSDLTLDRHDLLALVKAATGSPYPLPARANVEALNVMATKKLESLGWRPGGMALLGATLRAMLAAKPFKR